MQIQIEEIKKLAHYMPGNIIIYEINNGLNRLYYSEGVPGLSGYTREEYEEITMDPLNIIVPLDRLAVAGQIEKAKKTGDEMDFSYRLIHKTKECVWIKSHVKNVKLADDTHIFVESLYDATNEIENNQFLLDASEQGVVVFDKISKEVLYGNKNFFEFAGKNKEECIGAFCYDVVCGMGTWDEQRCTCFKALNSGETIKVYDKSKDKTVTITAKSIAWGEHDAIAFYTEDITEKERNIKRIEEKYESELQIRNELLKKANIYFMANMTKKQVLEMRTMYFDNNRSSSPQHFTEEGWNKNISENVMEPYAKKMVELFGTEGLKKAYNQGKTDVRLEYFKMKPGFSTHWFEAQANLVKQPETGDFIVLLYIVDCDDEYKQRLAQKSVLAREIDFTTIVDVNTMKCRLVAENFREQTELYQKEYDYNEVIINLVSSKIAEDSRDDFAKAFDFENVKKELALNKYLSVAYNQNSNNEVRRKQIKAYYLDESQENIVFVGSDITDSYREEMERRKELENAVMVAERASQAKTDFLSRMSHDIRTPMNAIIGMTDLAQDENQSRVVDEYLKNIDTSSHFLLGLINDILDLSKIESGQIELHPAPYKLNDFLRSINTVFRPMMDEKHINFKFEINCEITTAFVDSLRLNQIFFNLLSNAVKFTEKNGHIEFTAEDVKGENGRILNRFHVKDDGIGMSKAFMAHMYDVFSQEHFQTTSGGQGTGLGLPIAKSLVETMGGTIIATSKLGEGTEFIVDIPMESCDLKVSSDEQRAISDDTLQGLNILLVEDNDMNIIVARKLLEKKKINVEVAKNGLEAVNLFENSQAYYYDAILMDVRMPIMGGLEATTKIRKSNKEDAKSVPIIAMTADSFSEDRLKTIEVGMNAHLSKPIEPKLLYQTIQKFAEKE